jgi:hypothetical protein
MAHSFSHATSVIYVRIRDYFFSNLVLLLLVLSCIQQDEPKTTNDEENITEYYQNGKVQAEFSMKNGVKQGLGKIYYLNGKLSSECNYNKGLKHGIEKKFYSDGTLYRTREYYEGKLNGTEKRFYRNGQLKTLITYKQGMPGKGLVEYKPNGTKITEYPEFRYEIIFDRDYQKQKLVLFYFAGIDKNVHFYRGGLVEGKFFDDNKMSSGVSDGRGEIALSPDFQGELIISAKYVTPFRAPYVLEKKIVIN